MTEPLEHVSVPETLAGDYAIHMRGDGMAPGIQNGDLLIARKTDTAENGKVVIALYKGEGIARRYSRDGQTVHLKADNPTVEDLEVPASDVEVLGVVTGLWRDL